MPVCGWVGNKVTTSPYILTFYVPLTHKEAVKQALFEAGAGKIGNYECCCFESIGRGQFRPLQGAKPFLGDINKVEYVDEARIEMMVSAACAQVVINVLKSSHPYETPAWNIVATESVLYE
jgi:structural hemagglutinin/hemolysin toxin protein RtxA